MRKYATTLVIPDAHDGPEHNKDRFEALGNFIVENKPDNIVQIGDFMNLDSINFFDTNKPLIKEGKRLKDDIDSGIEAYEKIMKPIRNLWKKQARWKTKKYNPNRYWLLGNHEVRTWRYTLDKPELSGFIPETDFVGAGKDKWDIIRRRAQIYIDMLNDLGPIEAGKWVINNVPEKERESMAKYIAEGLLKDETT